MTQGSIAVVGAPSSPEHVRRLIVSAEDAIRAEGVAIVEIAGRAFPISRGFLDDLAEHDLEGRVGELGRPLLVVHAVDDDVVEVANGERIFASARQPKAFVPLLGADHLVTDRAQASRLARLLVGWLDDTL